jgi:hypothetical protein
MKNRSACRRTLDALLLGLLFLGAPVSIARPPLTTSAMLAATEIAATNPPPARLPASSFGTPLPAASKRKAGILAGTGLAILSLLALAVGLALARTFKR